MPGRARRVVAVGLSASSKLQRRAALGVAAEADQARRRHRQLRALEPRRRGHVAEPPLADAERRHPHRRVEDRRVERSLQATLEVGRAVQGAQALLDQRQPREIEIALEAQRAVALGPASATPSPRTPGAAELPAARRSSPPRASTLARITCGCRARSSPATRGPRSASGRTGRRRSADPRPRGALAISGCSLLGEARHARRATSMRRTRNARHGVEADRAAAAAARAAAPAGRASPRRRRRRAPGAPGAGSCCGAQTRSCRCEVRDRAVDAETQPAHVGARGGKSDRRATPRVHGVRSATPSSRSTSARSASSPTAAQRAGQPRAAATLRAGPATAPAVGAVSCGSARQAAPRTLTDRAPARAALTDLTSRP